ncbi:MAG: cysteine desulfurase-like protein, partial [Vibrio cyclitrophicus]
ALGLVKQLGIEEQGVVRIGCMHYNSIDEIDLLFNVLEGILRSNS